MLGHLKVLQTNKFDEMGASDDSDTSSQLQGNEKNDSHVHFQKYPTGSLMLKKLDSGELNGFVKSFDTQSGGYTVQWSNNKEALSTEYLTGIFVVKSPNSNISKKKNTR